MDAGRERMSISWAHIGGSAMDMVDTDGACAPTIDPHAVTQLLKPGRLRQEVDIGRAAEGSTAEGRLHSGD